MNERTKKRSSLPLTQAEAAQKAGISLSTWRRWEADPDSVSAKTRASCEGVLALNPKSVEDIEDLAPVFEDAWSDSDLLTPRQAYALAAVLNWWADRSLSDWLENPEDPLYEVEPFDQFDIRVMMLVGENRAWVEAVKRRCYKIAAEIESGIVPFNRPGPFIDEVLMRAAVEGARELFEEMPDLFDPIEARPSTGMQDSSWADDSSGNESFADDSWTNYKFSDDSPAGGSWGNYKFSDGSPAGSLWGNYKFSDDSPAGSLWGNYKFADDSPADNSWANYTPADDDSMHADDDWDAVMDGFGDICRWDEWEVPLLKDHPLLPAIVERRHPFRWFDNVEATGPSFMQRLAGLEVDPEE